MWEIDQVKLSWMDRCEVLSVLRERVLSRHAKFKLVSLQRLLSTGKKMWRGMQSWTKANAKSVWGNISHCAATSACRQNVKHSGADVWSAHEHARIKSVGTEWWVSCSRDNSVYLYLSHESHVWYHLCLYNYCLHKAWVVVYIGQWGLWCFAGHLKKTKHNKTFV